MGRNDTLSFIRSSFPGHDRQIEQAIRESDAFRELCRDLERCVAVLHCWAQSDAAEAPKRRLEYTELRSELSREIESWLAASES